jgi:hypothetical protein
MANDWTNCNVVACWNFDNSPNDSVGNNDLIEQNSPTYDASDKIQGTHSIDFERDDSDHCYCPNANLDAGFPCRDGEAEMDFSICGRVKFESLPTSGSEMNIISKYIAPSGFVVDVWESGGNVNFYFAIGYGAATTWLKYTHDTVSPGVWYSWGVTYNAATNGMKIRIYNGVSTNEETTTAGGNNTTNTGSVAVAYTQVGGVYTDGKMDEIVVFNKCLSSADIDAIIAQTYGPCDLTSLAPTTLAPTTLAPTTLPPTTLPPTTLAPTTAYPTTGPPTTLGPTTLPATTLLPTTGPPTTLGPTSLAPSTLPPTTGLPTTAPPTTLAPTSLAPTSLAPTTLGPTTAPPTTAPPTTLPPTAQEIWLHHSLPGGSVISHRIQ